MVNTYLEILFPLSFHSISSLLLGWPALIVLWIDSSIFSRHFLFLTWLNYSITLYVSADSRLLHVDFTVDRNYSLLGLVQTSIHAPLENPGFDLIISSLFHGLSSHMINICSTLFLIKKLLSAYLRFIWSVWCCISSLYIL